MSKEIIHIYLDKNLADKLKELASIEDRPVSNYVRQLIKNHIVLHNNKVYEPKSIYK